MKSGLPRASASRGTAVSPYWRRYNRQWLLLAIVLLGFGLRVYHLGAQELRGDEAFGYFFSLPPYGDIVRATLALHEPHPVAGYFVEKTWLLLAGDSEFGLRFMSTWWATLAVALLHRLGRRLGLSAWASMLGAMLLAISPYALWHSQDARMYSMSLALTLASTWLALEAAQRGRWLHWSAYILVTWLALQTHYFAIFVILAQNAFIIPMTLFIWRWPIRTRDWILSQLTVGLLTLPWLVMARDTLMGYGGNGDSPAFAPMLIRSLSVFAAGETAPMAQRTFLALCSGFLIAVGVARLLLAGSPHRWTAGFLLLYLFIPLLSTWVGALHRPIFNERYLVAAAPAFYLLLAVSVGCSLARMRLAVRRSLHTVPFPVGAAAAIIFLIVVVGAMISVRRYYVDPAYGKLVGWRELAKTIDRFSAGLPAEQVLVAQNFPDPTLWYYYRGSVRHIVLPPRALDAQGATREVADAVEAGVRRVILPVQLASWWDDRGIASEALAGAYGRVAEDPIGVWSVEVYARPAETLQAIGATFANGLVLEAAAVEPSQVPAGGLLVVHLRWQVLRSTLHTVPFPVPVSSGEKITVQVLNPSRKLVAQTDQPFVADQVAGRTVGYSILLPDERLAPGDYQVILALYNPEQSGAPRLQIATGSDFVLLATIEIP